MTMKKLMLLGLGLLAFGCGKEEKKQEQASDVIDSKYQKNWDKGYFPPSSSPPTVFKTGCVEPTAGGSYDTQATVDKDSFATTTNRYLGNTECAGEQYVKATVTITLASVDKTDDRQIVKGVSSQLKVVVKGAEAVTFMKGQKNGAGACGSTNWAEGTYTQDSDIIKGCTSSNQGDLAITPATAEETKNKRIRLKRLYDDAMEVGEKKESEDDSVFDTSKVYWKIRR